MQNSLQKGKRALSTAVAAATMLWSVGFSSFVAPLTARAAVAGDLIKGQTLSTVYYYGSDGKRYAFPNEKTYFTWYSDFSSVQTISDSQLAAIPLGGNISYRPGSRWIKIQSDPKTYAVTPNGTLRWIETEAVAVGLAGSDWNQFIDDVADVFFVDYTVGASLTSAANAYNGALVKATDGSFYVIQNNQKRPVTSAGFSANRMQSRFALDGSGVNLAAMATGASVTGRETGLSDTAQLPETSMGGLTVSLASDSPAVMTVPSQATSVTMMKFNLSASSASTVNSITVKQGGVGSTSTVSSVYLYEGNTRLTDGRSLNSSSREATFTGLNLALTAGQTRTLSVVVDMANNATGGDTISFEIEAAGKVTGTGASVSGTFPVRGATMTTSATDVGTLTLTKSGTITNPTLGQKQATIAEFKLSADAVEGARLMRIRLDVREASSHANFNLFQNNTLVAVGTRTASDKVDFTFTNPFEIAQGSNKIFQMKADIGGQNGDDIAVSVDETTDIYAVGTKYGFGLAISNTTYGTTGSSCNDTSDSCSFSEVQGGKVTFAFNGPAATRFKPDQTGVVLMNFTITSQNDVQIRNLGFDLAGTDFDGTATSDANFQNFRLVNRATGATIAGPEEFDGVFNDEADSVTFPDDWNMRAGESMDVQLLVDAKGSSSPYDVAAGETITATLDVSDTQIRDANNDDLTVGTDIIPGADLTGNTMTAQAAAVTISVSQPPSSRTIVKGAQNEDVVAHSFVAGPASSIRISSLKYNAIGDADATYSDEADVSIADRITSCSVYDSSTNTLVDGPESFTTTGSSGSYVSTITFNGFNWTIPAGSTAKAVLRCNFSNIDQATGADDDYVFYLDNDVANGGNDTSADVVTATDTDGNTVADTAFTDAEANNPDGSESVIISVVNSGSMAFSVDSSNPESMIILSNTTGVTVSKFRVSAARESFLIKKLTVKSNGTSILPGVNNVVLEYVDQSGATQTSIGSLAAGEVTFDNLSLYAPKDTPAVFSVKVNTGEVTTDNTASGDVIQMELHMDEVADDQFEAIGLSSGATLDDDATDASVSGAVTGFTTDSTTDDDDTDIRLTPSPSHEERKAKPTISLAAGSPSGAKIPGLDELLRFNVMATSAATVDGYVTLDKVTFAFTATDTDASGWEECDLDAADGLNLADATEWEIYNLDTPGTKLDDGTTPWTFFDETGDACDNTSSDLSYAVINFGASGGSIASEQIAAGQTKTYVVRVDTTGASDDPNDSVRLDIPDQSTINSLSIGSGTDLDDDAVIQWDDSNLENADALDIDGDYVKNLPVNGGTIVY